MSEIKITLDKEYDVQIEEIKMTGRHLTIAYHILELGVRAWLRVPPDEFSVELMREKIALDIQNQMPALELLKELKEKYEGQIIKVGNN